VECEDGSGGETAKVLISLWIRDLNPNPLDSHRLADEMVGEEKM